MKSIKVDDNVRKLKMLLEARQRLKGLLSGRRNNFEETETEYVDDTRFHCHHHIHHLSPLVCH